MADTSPPGGLRNRTNRVFSLAGQLGRTWHDEHTRQRERGRVDATSWARDRPAFDEFCAAVLDLRDATQNPPASFAPVLDRPGRTTRTSGKGKGSSRSYPTLVAAVASLEGKHGHRSAVWTYHDAAGEPVGAVVRWDGPDGKDIRPLARHADGWRIGAMPDPRPLYALPELAAASHVVVTEGEKAADATRSAGAVPSSHTHDGNVSRFERIVVWNPSSQERGIRLAVAYRRAVLALQQQRAVVRFQEDQMLYELQRSYRQLAESRDVFAASGGDGRRRPGR